jgi:tellurite methyltransferase
MRVRRAAVIVVSVRVVTASHAATYTKPRGDANAASSHRIDAACVPYEGPRPMSEDVRSRWDRRWAEQKDLPRSVPSWVAELESEIPRGGRGLDVAAGSGRMAVYLARRGLEMTAVDISPVGLALCREAGRDEGLTIKTLVCDLEAEGLPEGPWNVIACFHYRQPDLFRHLDRALSLGGVVIAEVETQRALERHPQRPGARWLAEPNELLHITKGLEIVYYREGWIGERSLARIIARRAA